MNQYVGRILEFRLEADGRRSAVIACPEKAVPAPGQYVLAHAPSDPNSLLAEPLFLQQKSSAGFHAAPSDTPFSPFWEIGAELSLRGPAGNGFTPPGQLRNLALVALGNTAARLLPLLETAENAALFTDLPFHNLPTKVEIQPAAAYGDASPWADFVAVDVPLLSLDQHRNQLAALRPPVQLLITTPMPCAGLAECGVCAVQGRKRSQLLLCVDGPVISNQQFSDTAL